MPRNIEKGPEVLDVQTELNELRAGIEANGFETRGASAKAGVLAVSPEGKMVYARREAFGYKVFESQDEVDSVEVVPVEEAQVKVLERLNS